MTEEKQKHSVEDVGDVTDFLKQDSPKSVVDTSSIGIDSDETSILAGETIARAEDVAIKVISTQDDPSLPVLTFRAVFLGVGLSAFSSVLGTIYTFKPQNATVSQLFCLIIAYVLGTAMAAIIPRAGYFRWLNPGPFNVKEHAFIVIMSSTASSVAVGMEIIAALDLFYDLRLNAAVALFQIFATQMLGYGIAGMLRSFLVYPTYAFYPTYISVVSLLQSLHFRSSLNEKRRKFFWIVFAGIFCWEWIPQYPFPLLTAISVICLADNGRHEFYFLDAYHTGKSSRVASPNTYVPYLKLLRLLSIYSFNSEINSYIGLALGYLILTACYYSNVFNGRDLAFMSTSLFGEDGQIYNQSAVIGSDYKLNHAALEVIGLPRYTTTYAISQLSYNVSLGAAASRSEYLRLTPLKSCLLIAFGGLRFLRQSHDEIDDPHYQGPHDACYLWQSWSILIFTVFSILMAIILGFITATTGFSISVKYVVQIMAAFIHPGQPIPVMYSNLFGNSTSFQTLYMLQDLKLGQYIKLPPRMTFVAQIAGSIVGSIFNYTMMKVIVSNNREVLKDPIGTRVWSGWIIQGYNSASIAMGALGKELFSLGKPAGYWIIPFGIVIGLFAPLPFWIVWKFSRPGSRLSMTMEYINVPIVALYIGWLPYSVNGQWWSCVVIGFVSQWWLRTRKPRWFIKYNYLLSAALDGGSQVILFILSFAVFGAGGKAVAFPTWWGNPENLSADRCKST
ncbi:hypothetical protein EYR40_006017 [Pleurotus pulmonarius]|nr:hypothetical protein EYR40_006017 [Pleurotus pulmonarius]